MNSQLSKGMMIVLVTNIINLAFNLITNFALPKYLSVETYATIRTYQMYVTYIGLVHFGYIDGVYLGCGGKELDQIARKEFCVQRGSLLLLQLIITVLFIVPGLFTHDIALIALCCTAIPFNVTQYYKMVYQATGEFSLYGKINNYTTILIFAVNFFLLFVFRIQNVLLYLLGYVLAYFLIWGIVELQFARRIGSVLPLTVSLKDLVSNIQRGCLLMLGNLSSIILTGIDRWFVKFWLDDLAFAQYSFAVSMEGMLNVVITPISTTLYNFFCTERDIRQIHRTLNYVSLFAVAVVSCAFPAKFIVERLLENYQGSLFVLFLLFAGQIFFIIIKCVYVNLYKARQMQRPYFTKLAGIIGFGIIINVICFLLWRRKESFALGTLLSAILWFILCQKDFPDQKPPLQYFIYLFTETLLFLLCGQCLSTILGFCAYIAGSILITVLLMRQPLTELLKMILHLVKREKA